jgi:Uma2 family endonuclease
MRNMLAMSEDAYFEMIEKSIDKYEYWNGVAVRRTGILPEHVAIEMNISGELFQQLRGKDCRPLGPNQAVKLAGSKGYVFPDLSIACCKPEYVVKRGIGCLLNPTVVVEVLSPSTTSFDEMDKFVAYTGIRSIREYLIVSSNRHAVKLYSRDTADEVWSVRVYEDLTDVVDLESCGCRLTLSEIYSNVEPRPTALGPYPAA